MRLCVGQGWRRAVDDELGVGRGQDWTESALVAWSCLGFGALALALAAACLACLSLPLFRNLRANPIRRLGLSLAAARHCHSCH